MKSKRRVNKSVLRERHGKLKGRQGEVKKERGEMKVRQLEGGGNKKRECNVDATRFSY